MPRFSLSRIADVVDGRSLRVSLTAAALDHIGDEAGARKAALRLLHGALFRGRMIAKERLEDGAGGLETAHLLARVADEVIQALFDFTTTHVIRSRNPTQGERFAIVAVGGYGRGELAPSSDIDLLFLRAYKPTPYSESVTEYLLYMLWDMALKVGHSSRTVDECLRLARDDHTIQTALLEARHLCGDESLTRDLVRRYRAEVAEPGHRAFVAAKLKERDERRARSGASAYLVEPNVKESAGGLRDLQMLFWLLKHRYGWEDAQAYVSAGVLTPKELGLFSTASKFLWRVRCHLHFLVGRAEERLTFDVQPEMARRLGFVDRGGKPAVERFMKRYFLAASEVGALSRILAAKLEADRPRSPLEGLFAGVRRAVAPNFFLEGGRLHAEPGAFVDDPVNLLRLFAIAAERNLDIHPDALAQARRACRLITPALRENPEAASSFLAAATARGDPAAALRLMNETGVLGRFVPEFGRIVAQMQYNMYHHYTVDEHTLRAIEIISRIEHDELTEDHPLACSIFPKIHNRRALYLAMLLHDTGKGEGDQQIEGAAAARAVCERLGLPPEDVDLVAWLVGKHLLMSDVAQKRDLADPATLAAFAGEVQSLERLRLLLVLTVADIRAVGPSVWNGWKGQLLRDLYRLTEAVFHGGRTDEAAVRARLAAQAVDARAEAEALLGPSLADAARTFLDSLEDGYWLSFTPQDVAWQAREALAAPDSAGVRIAVRTLPGKSVADVLVLAPDQPGLFARLAAAFAMQGADVRDARALTTRDAIAVDVFSIQNASGEPFGADEPQKLERLLERLREACAGAAPGVLKLRPSVVRRTAAFAVQPWARLDNELSSTATVVEVSGRDRPGLLAELAQVFAEERLAIASARVDVVGERASDVFYIVDETGARITDEGRLQSLQARLVEALRRGEPAAPSTLAHEPMATAPASDAR